MNRQHRGLHSPAGIDPSSVPSVDCSDQEVHRAVAAQHPQPWRFSNRTDAGAKAGRFDLDGDRGTCYFATTPAGAVIERVSDPEAEEPTLISTDTLESMNVWSGRVPSATRMADVTVRSVPQLTDEISAIEEYDLPWAWADALDEDGRTGILYVGRFAMEPCLAVFGDKGVPRLDVQPAVLSSKAAPAYELELPEAWREVVTRTPNAEESEQAPPPPEQSTSPRRSERTTS